LPAILARMNDRPHAITLFGATGFTGALAARYLAEHAPAGTQWAIAGRNAAKLESVRRSLEGTACPPSAVLEANATDDAALEKVARASRVIATTVGPYELHGFPVVRAAVRGGADYVDITGEPAFVDRTIAELSVDAEKARVRVVSCCGFDSIPHDLGAQFTAEKLAALGAGDRPMTIEGFVRSRGTFSGGTWQSAIEAMGRIREQRPRARKSKPEGGRRVRSAPLRIKWVPELTAWGCPLPTIDPQIVLRSAARLSEYGPDFQYGHFVRVRSLPTVIVGVSAVGAIVALSQLGPTRALLKRVKQSGEGPTEAQRSKSWFEVTFLGRAGDLRVTTSVAGGDPGYGETAKMISESALCLALDRKKLPDAYGVITTAVAMGPVLRERLVKAGIRFQVKS
jgi:short subunit dehydrogenase-like uncharacterized protein